MSEHHDFIDSYWVAVDGPECGPFERMFHHKPVRAYSGADLWIDEKTKDEIQKHCDQWIGDNDYSMVLPKGTIKKLIGKDLTWDDEPVKIEINLSKY